MAADEVEDIGTRIVYENRWMRVREDAIRRRDGSSGIYGVVEKPDFVVIVPVEDDGRLYLVQQFRYPVQGRYWELPQSSWEQAPGAGPMEAARGELREETGLAAARMTYAGHLFEACGYSNQGFHIFVATDLRRGEDDRELEEQDLVTREFSLSEVERMIREGEIKDATTVAALGLLRLKGLLYNLKRGGRSFLRAPRTDPTEPNSLDPTLRQARIGAHDVDVEGMKRMPELGQLVVADRPVWLTRNTLDQLANAITPIAG